MGFSPDGFLRRLRAGKAVSCTYQAGEFAGLINAWLHAGVFVLTWEEWKEGDFYNENAYTRDERHTFDTAEEVLAFVEREGYPASRFSP